MPAENFVPSVGGGEGEENIDCKPGKKRKEEADDRPIFPSQKSSFQKEGGARKKSFVQFELPQYDFLGTSLFLFSWKWVKRKGGRKEGRKGRGVGRRHRKSRPHSLLFPIFRCLPPPSTSSYFRSDILFLAAYERGEIRRRRRGGVFYTSLSIINARTDRRWSNSGEDAFLHCRPFLSGHTICDPHCWSTYFLDYSL